MSPSEEGVGGKESLVSVSHRYISHRHLLMLLMLLTRLHGLLLEESKAICMRLRLSECGSWERRRRSRRHR